MTFTRADFPASGIKTHRIARPIIAELLSQCLLPDHAIVDAAAWMRELVSQPSRSLSPPTSGERGRGRGA